MCHEDFTKTNKIRSSLLHSEATLLFSIVNTTSDADIST